MQAFSCSLLYVYSRFKRKYVLKSLSDFVLARLRNSSLQYGKDFTYEPSLHYLEEKDEPILDFIEDFISTKGLLVDDSYGFDMGSSKQLKIAVSSLRRFLEISSHKKINYLTI